MMIFFQPTGIACIFSLISAFMCVLLDGALKAALAPEERAAGVRWLPGSHDGKTERLCCSRDDVAATMVELLAAPDTTGKRITLVDGVAPVRQALAAAASECVQ